MSWYDTAIKLNLSGVSNDGENKPILGHLIDELIQESSIKSRKSPEMVSTNLILSQSNPPLPHLQIQSTNNAIIIDKNKAILDKFLAIKVKSLRILHTEKSKQHQTPNQHISIKKKVDYSNIDRYSKSKTSAENWIPENIRLESINRDLSIAKSNLEDIRFLDEKRKLEQKLSASTDLDKARKEESLGTSKKVSCGCCMQLFLPLNLPQAVSQKAIMDIRNHWSRELLSSTLDSTSKISILSKSSDIQRGTIRYYDQVKVCYFCAQFFQEQELYRPSFQDIKYEERKALHFDAMKREREYWDPLKMCEKDREMEGNTI